MSERWGPQNLGSINIGHAPSRVEERGLSPRNTPSARLGCGLAVTNLVVLRIGRARGPEILGVLEFRPLADPLITRPVSFATGKKSDPSRPALSSKVESDTIHRRVILVPFTRQTALLGRKRKTFYPAIRAGFVRGVGGVRPPRKDD